MVRILILDPNSIARNGLQLIIDELAEFKVVGLAKDYVSLKKIIEFDKSYILLMRLSKTPDPELKQCARITSFFPKIKVLLITQDEGIALLINAVASGTHGVYYESTGPSRLEEALTRISKGGYFFDGRIKN